jgi:hypothetical protein
MADTSLIFNIIARDSGLGRALDGISNRFRGAGAAAEEALEQAGSSTQNLDRQIAEAQSRVRALSEEFERTGDKTLFSKIARDRSLLSQLTKVRDGLRNVGSGSDDTDTSVGRLSGTLGRAGGAAVGFGGSLVSAGGSAMGMLGSISGLVIAAAGLAAFQLVAAPAIYAFGGALASLPAVISGVIGMLAVLKMGMSGLGKNWQAMNAPKTGGGGGGGGGAPPIDMTPKIRAVEAAQRDVARSARDVTEAQEELADAHAAVSKAQETAKERISDLNREYRQAQQDQAEAVQSLTEAEQQLRLAQGRGNPDEIMRAQLAVDKQRLAVEEAADKTDDLGKESKEAARKGVEGSDEVVAARERERDAAQRVRDSVEAHKLAIQRLGDAQADLKRKIDSASASAGGMGGVTLPKIARSAQEFLDELKRLKPAFDDLRLEIQQRLFEGLAGKLRVLAERWLPALRTGLGGMADMINGVVKTAFDSLSKPEFIQNMLTGFQHFTSMLGDIGQAIAGPLVDAWGRLTRASAPILDVIGEKVSGIIIRFSEWIAKMDESGKLDAFMEKAAHMLGLVFDMFEDLGRIAGSVISILFGTNLGSTDAWENFADILDRVADFLGNPDNQAKISTYVDRFGGFASMVGNFLAEMDKIPGRIDTAIAWFKALPERVGAYLSRLPGQAGQWFSSMVSTMGYWVGYGIGWVVKQFINLPSNVWRAIQALPGVFRAIGSWLMNALNNLPGQMFAIGYNIVVGIWRGISSMANWLWQQTYNFAASIWRGVQDALGISSPSRVMADKVGQWIPKGIAAGMDANRGSVMDAVGRISDDLAAADLAVPTVGMDEAMAAATGTLTVGARRQRLDVRSVLDVTGQEGKLKTLIRSMARTENLYQNTSGSAA